MLQETKRDEREEFLNPNTKPKADNQNQNEITPDFWQSIHQNARCNNTTHDTTKDEPHHRQFFCKIFKNEMRGGK